MRASVLNTNGLEDLLRGSGGSFPDCVLAILVVVFFVVVVLAVVVVAVSLKSLLRDSYKTVLRDSYKTLASDS